MALTILAANNASTVLAAGISASATSLTVASGAGAEFPTPVSGTSFFKLTLVDAATESLTEIMHVTAVSGDAFTVVRGQEGTTARAWSVNDIVANMLTAGTLDYFAQLDSPAFTGRPTTPTANAGTNTTQIASTAFVTTALLNTTGRLVSPAIIFTTSGSYSPSSANVKFIKQTVIGAGGGGSGCNAVNTGSIFAGAGGGAGGTGIGYSAVTFGTAYPVTIGSGGAGGVGAASGTAGGASTFNGITSNGGNPGTRSPTVQSSSGGVGGTSTGGTISIQGGDGSDGLLSTYMMAGNGGASSSGGGGRAGQSAGGVGKAYGSGGGGAYDVGFSGTSYTGGAGKAGVVIIEEFF